MRSSPALHRFLKKKPRCLSRFDSGLPSSLGISTVSTRGVFETGVPGCATISLAAVDEPLEADDETRYKDGGAVRGVKGVFRRTGVPGDTPIGSRGVLAGVVELDGMAEGKLGTYLTVR